MKDQGDLESQQKKPKIVDEAVERVKQLPPEQKAQAIEKLEMYSGPIPHPDILKKYDDIDPGAAKLIIENGVDESKHRRKMESDSLEYARRDNKRRDYMGFSIGLVGMGIGGLLIWLNHTVTGTIFSGVSLVMLVSLFLGKSNNDQSKTDS
ncbi:DUF2335 domain-containing protein [Liquorilactobacillus nagelii]|jgi:uncharacterized membrane protein|uniref:DUF2335 domain-containing protein n=1 Tax=Liquorilactobacillus nagelii TaxID=82688 RepID=UPI0024315D89|nr:DUF2335 domain-containing protein [Liquorilactobacillus nagelii]MCI1699483.1 DUF2335 domain-containing protein [Liquorilactobacillus nagelii]